MHWFPVLERTGQHVACKGAGMLMYFVMEQAMIGKTPDRTLTIYSQHGTLYVKLIYSEFLISSLFLTTPLATNPCLVLFITALHYSKTSHFVYLARHSSLTNSILHPTITSLTATRKPTFYRLVSCYEQISWSPIAL